MEAQRFRLEDYLNKAQLETASLLERKSFWNWLRDNWRTISYTDHQLPSVAECQR